MKRSISSTSSIFKKPRELQPELIQPDYSIKLNNFQLIKKFRGIRAFNTPAFYEYILGLESLRFVLTFEGSEVRLTPYFKRDSLNYDPGILQRFISYQLLNSGILEQLRNIPHHEAVVDGKKRENKIIVSLKGSNNSITSYSYHNDSNLFQILKYYKTDLSPVLGTEVLFTDQRKYIVHEHMNRLGEYDPKEGPILFTQREINTMYDTIMPENVILRGLYNSGDTLVINDMLVKHAVVNPMEDIVDNILKIEIHDGRHNVDIGTDIQVCKSRIRTTENDHSNRGIVRIAVLHMYANSGDVNYIDTSSLSHDLSFLIDSTTIDVPEQNFNIEEYAMFLNTLASAENIETGRCVFSDVTILSSGRTKRKKRTRKNSKKRKNLSRNSRTIHNS